MTFWEAGIFMRKTRMIWGGDRFVAISDVLGYMMSPKFNKSSIRSDISYYKLAPFMLNRVAHFL